jgi:purine-binding chemotaxis protein CheW
MNNKDKINDIIKEAEKDRKSKDKEKSKIVKEFLIIDVDSNFFALQLEYLREVFDLANKNDIVPIPFTPPHIMGIINIRGEIIPVISMLNILGVERKSSNYLKIAVLEEKFKIAFPFTDIYDLKSMDIASIKEIKNAAKKTKEQFLSQEFESDDKFISIIDMLKVFSSEYLI